MSVEIAARTGRLEAALSLRSADPTADRERCHAVIRRALVAGGPAENIHPGELDWWCFHREPGTAPPILLLGPTILVYLDPHSGELAVFGATPGELRVVLDALGPAARSTGLVTVDDHERIAVIEGAGFVDDGREPERVFARPVAGGIDGTGAHDPDHPGF